MIIGYIAGKWRYTTIGSRMFYISLLHRLSDLLNISENEAIKESILQRFIQALCNYIVFRVTAFSHIDIPYFFSSSTYSKLAYCTPLSE